MNNIVEIKNLTKKYNSFVLNDINLKIPSGVIVGIIGENGAGKTTLIKSMLNMIKIDSGDIKIFNMNMKENEDIIKEDIGVVFDDSFLSEYLTLKDISKIMKRIYKNWSDEKYNKIIEKFNLPLDKIVNKFSSGMKMKTKLAVAFSSLPKLLILDEPTSSLDPIIRNEILNLFQEFIEDGEHSIIFSTHITSDLEHVADYVVYMEKGEIIFNKEKDILTEKYGIIKTTKEELDKIDKEDIIKILKNKYNIEVLIKDKSKYKNYIIDKPTVEDIMIMYAKGEK